MDEKKIGLQVRMFGRFEMMYQEKELQIETKMRTKPLRLLPILLHAGAKELHDTS